MTVAEKQNVLTVLFINLVMLQLLGFIFQTTNAVALGADMYNSSQASVNATHDVVFGNLSSTYGDVTTYFNLTGANTQTSSQSTGGILSAVEDIWDRLLGAVEGAGLLKNVVSFVLDATIPVLSLYRYLYVPIASTALGGFVLLFIGAYQVVIFNAWLRLLLGKNRME